MYRLEVLHLNLLTEPSEKGKYYDKRKMIKRKLSAACIFVVLCSASVHNSS